VEATGAERLLLLRQVHGVRVVFPGDGEERPEADGWAGCPEEGVLLGVLTADCLPALLCHPPSRTVGLAHAGWRGAAAGVASAALKAMGVAAEEVVAALGPSIHSCCYQVGEEVAAAVGRASPHLSRWPDQPGRYRLDLPGLVRGQLVEAGMKPSAIEVLPLCTACRADLFYSHRRDRSRGRMCGFLGWNPSGHGA
jgi:YfiH family protein